MSEEEFHDCSEVLDQLYAFHDRELSEEEADHIREHLLACEPCLDQFQVEEALRTLIKKSCNRDAQASAGLRLRVQTSYSRMVVFTEDAG